MNNVGVGDSNPLHSQKSMHNLLIAHLIFISPSMQSTNSGLCSTVVFTIEKKFVYNWTITIQTCVVQGSTVIQKLWSDMWLANIFFPFCRLPFHSWQFATQKFFRIDVVLLVLCIYVFAFTICAFDIVCMKSLLRPMPLSFPYVFF